MEKQMNSRQYEKKMNEYYTSILEKNGLFEGDYTSVCLSADRSHYTVKLTNGNSIIVDSELEPFED